MITPKLKYQLHEHIVDLGYTVEYQHLRYMVVEDEHCIVGKCPFFVYGPASIRELMETCDHGRIWNFGGVTIAKISNKENHLCTGMAFCSISDNFCKATGRNIALRRAYEALKLIKE